MLLFVFSAAAQFSSNRNYSLEESGDVIIINGIDSSTELLYDQAHTTINWYKFSDPNTSISNLNYISPDGDTGYIVEVDGKEETIWVLDYQSYLPNLNEFEPVLEESTCENTVFRINQNAVPEMPYYVLGNSAPRYIKREFTIKYNTKEYSEKTWDIVEKTENITFPTSEIEVGASLLPNAEFTLSGDQIADVLGLEPFSIKSNDNAITAIESRLAVFVTVRNALNEVERPKESEPIPPITASAPIKILFEARPTDESALFDWKIYLENASTPLVTRTDKDHRYTFTSKGKYNVVLSVKNNDDCLYTDSVEINVNESLLEVPNVFTPNGDGVNDVFYVTYRSLASFHCWIYNNWGKLAYEWTNPERGWDGRVGGKKAPSGTYFYIIKAKGTDGVNYNLKGDVSIIR